MKKILLISLVLFSSAVTAQPYVVAGFAQTRVTAGDLHEDRGRLTLGAGYKVGNLAGEAACTAGTDCSLAGVATMPIAGGFSAVGKAGAYYLHGSLTSPNQPAGSCAGGLCAASSSTATWSGWTAGAGIGAQYSTGKAASVRVMLEQTGSVGALDRARTLSASLLYSF